MTDIINILHSMGFSTVPASFYGDIAVWESWYKGNVRNFHRYQVYNGFSHVDCRRYSMGMAKKVSEDWANLLLNEKVKITLEGKAEQEFFDSVCSSNNFTVKSNEMQELKAALGTAAYVVRASGVSVGNETGDVTNGEGAALKIDYVTAPNIFPLSWGYGTVKECAFSSAVMDGGKEYTYLQIHRKGEDGNYIIEATYPFSPTILDAIPEELAELFRGLELKLLEEICSRLRVADQLNEVTVQDIRALRSHGIDLEDIKKAIRKATSTGEEKLEKLLDDVVARNQQYYTEVIDLARVTALERLVDERDIAAIRRQTWAAYKNITGSMGFLAVQGGRLTFLEPAKAYEWALDSALLQVQSGAISYNQAIASAVRQLADSGIKTVDYESGYKLSMRCSSLRTCLGFKPSFFTCSSAKA